MMTPNATSRPIVCPLTLPSRQAAVYSCIRRPMCVLRGRSSAVSTGIGIRRVETSGSAREYGADSRDWSCGGHRCRRDRSHRDRRESPVPGTTRLARYRFLASFVRVGLVGCCLGSAAPSAWGDDFGRIVGPLLFDIPQRFERVGTGHLSLRAIESLPEVVRGERSALIIATTDEGNLAKVLVSQGLRGQFSAGGKQTLVPVISLDRYETIDRGDRETRKARGRDVLLFDGFEFDLDTGQVVPAGFGGDIRYTSHGASGPELVAVGKNRLYAIDKPLPVPASAPGRPSAGPAVLSTDFNGRYTLVSNG